MPPYVSDDPHQLILHLRGQAVPAQGPLFYVTQDDAICDLPDILDARSLGESITHARLRSGLVALTG